MTLQKAAEIIVKTCMNVKPEEKVLIITDKGKLQIAKKIFEESEKITKTKLIEIPIGKQHGEEPSKELSEEMKKYDVIIAPTTKSLSHTRARRNASQVGARISTLPGITIELMERCIDLDYHKLKVLHEKLRPLLLNSDKIRIVTEKGTDVEASVINVRADVPGLYHRKGDFGNLPTGEVDCGVREKSTNGKIVVDASFGGIGKMDTPLTLTIKDGYVTKIEGEDAETLKKRLDSIGKEAYKIAELGIGTNDKAIVSGNTLEDEKVLGTMHFGLGNDLTYGGTNDVPLHLDGIIDKPTIYIDDEKIMDKGKIL